MRQIMGQDCRQLGEGELHVVLPVIGLKRNGRAV